MGLGREAGLCHNRFLTMGMCAGRHSRWHFRRGFLVPGTKMVSRNRNLAKQERLSKHGGRAGKSDLRHGQGWSNAISGEWSVLIESLYGAHGGLTPVGVTPDLFLKPCQGSASHAGLRPRPRMTSCWSFFSLPTTAGQLPAYSVRSTTRGIQWRCSLRPACLDLVPQCRQRLPRGLG